jgi:hypothetical protein
MKKSLLTLVAVALFSVMANAQDYHGGVGIRIGGFASNGLTGKYFILPDVALEGILATRWGGILIAGLGEIHAPVFDINRLSYYYGPGAHIASWSEGRKTRWFDDNINHTVIGIDGIIGIEYTFAEIPFNIGFDVKPAFNIIGNFGFWVDEIALSVRYVW